MRRSRIGDDESLGHRHDPNETRALSSMPRRRRRAMRVSRTSRCDAVSCRNSEPESRTASLARGSAHERCRRAGRRARRDEGLRRLPARLVEEIGEILADQLFRVLPDQGGGGRIGFETRWVAASTISDRFGGESGTAGGIAFRRRECANIRAPSPVAPRRAVAAPSPGRAGRAPRRRAAGLRRSGSTE